MEEIRSAEILITKAAQAKCYEKEISILREGQEKEGTKVGSLHRLDPFLDRNGLLRVGGRIKRSNLPPEVKFPVILPRKSHLANLIISYFHGRVEHQGRGITLNEIRSNGYWVIGGTAAVAHCISRCVTCSRSRGATQEQKMADLPNDRMEPSPPFTYAAVDYCGPWYMKDGRKEVKRYIALFTCMASRAVHLEVARSLEADSFLNAFRRFISRRGPVRQLRCDQGTNFLGAKKELQEALLAMDKGKIKSELLKENCDWFEYKTNVPSASHARGVWERQIKTLRSVLSALIEKKGNRLNNESFQTFICEAEAILNCCPLTVDNLGDPTSPSPLLPMQVLTMKTKPVFPPPGIFQREDVYLLKRWRMVQHLTNEFWDRWKKEYLLSLQKRSKWTQARRNLQTDYIVVIKDENTPRNQWRLGRVVKTYPDDTNVVRSVAVAVGDPNISNSGKRQRPQSILDRPIQKLVLILPSERVKDLVDGEPPKDKVLGFQDGTTQSKPRFLDGKPRGC